jgi:hypothetical protein
MCLDGQLMLMNPGFQILNLTLTAKDLLAQREGAKYAWKAKYQSALRKLSRRTQKIFISFNRLPLMKDTPDHRSPS